MEFWPISTNLNIYEALSLEAAVRVLHNWRILENDSGHYDADINHHYANFDNNDNDHYYC